MKTLLETVKAELQRSKWHWPEVARRSGVPYKTIEKIASGYTGNPRFESVEMLAAFFRLPASEALVKAWERETKERMERLALGIPKPRRSKGKTFERQAARA